MSLTRGIKSLWPCPVCLVPHDDLLDALKTYPRRTSDQSQNILQVARGKQTAEERDDTLKQYGLRDVQVRFCYRYQWCFITNPSMLERFLDCRAYLCTLRTLVG